MYSSYPIANDQTFAIVASCCSFCLPDQIPVSFRPLLDSIVAAYNAACGSRLVGVYLRGSIPRGLFLPGISDVDTFAVVVPVTLATATTLHSSSSSGSGSSSDGEFGSSTTSSSSSSEASLYDLHQAVKRLSHAAVQAHQRLGYTKVRCDKCRRVPVTVAQFLCCHGHGALPCSLLLLL
jgi:hypothetical protein